MSRFAASGSLGAEQARRFPADPAERECALQQLERILAHPSFSHSKRYPNLRCAISSNMLSAAAFT